MRRAILLLPVMLAACGPKTADNATADNAIEAANESAAPAAIDDGAAPMPEDDTAAPAPSEPESTTPTPAETNVPEEVETPTGDDQPEATGQGAARVVQRYYALIGAGNYRQAYNLWAPGRAGMNAAQFARSFDRYAEYRVRIGAPGGIEGAAGSRYVTVPVQPYGRLKQGNRAFNMRGSITLRRTVVDGATAEQRRWRIHSADIKPRPGQATPTPTPQPTEDNRSVARYRCDGGVRMTARFDPDNGTVTVGRGGERLGVLQQQRSGSGIWYRGGGHELRGKGTAMTFTERGKPPLSCTAQVP